MATLSCVQLGDYVQSAVEICEDLASSVCRPGNRYLLGHFEADIGQILEIDPTLGGDREKWERLCNLTNSRLAGVEGTPAVVKLRGQSRLSFHSAALWLIDTVRSQIVTVTKEYPDWRTCKRARDAVFSGLRQIPLCDSLYEGKFATGLAREALEVSRDCQDTFEVLLPGEDDKISGPEGIPIKQWNWLKKQVTADLTWEVIRKDMKEEANKSENKDWRSFNNFGTLRKWYSRVKEKGDPDGREVGRPAKESKISSK